MKSRNGTSKKTERFFTPQLILGLLWIFVSLSLAAWWIIFSLNQLETLKGIQHEEMAHLVRQQTMLLQEGGFLFALLLMGGLSLFYYILREKKQSRLIKQFFAAFTHEVKTSLASLRLQAESLEEDLKDRPEERELSQRLVKDTVRLELQLENSLFLSRADQGELFFEKLSVRQIVQSLRHQWPELNLILNADAVLYVDRRALECLLKNIFQNAAIHGRANTIEMNFSASGDQKVRLTISDNGSGFAGEFERLGTIFVRHTSKSGSGLGLYLVKMMAERLNGEVQFKSAKPSGFCVELELPGQFVNPTQKTESLSRLQERS